MENFFSSVELGVDSFETINGSKFSSPVWMKGASICLFQEM